VQLARVLHWAILLIIRRSWVRAPPAPPAVLIPVVGEPWTGSYTDVGGAMFEPSGRIWSHRVAVERVWRTKAYGGKDRTGCLRGSPRVCGTGQRVLPPTGYPGMTRRGWSDLGFREVAEDTNSMCIGKGLIVPGPPQQERPPDLGSLRATRRQILAAASQRGLRDVRVFGSVARGEAIETSDVDLLVAPGPDTTLFDLSGFALDVEEIVGRHVDVATPRGLKARIRDRVLAEAVAL